LESLDRWLVLNGLRHDSAPEDTADHVEHEHRIAAEQAHVDAVHTQAFAQSTAEEERQAAVRQTQLASWEGRTLRLVSAQGVVVLVALPIMAAACEMVYALASSWSHFHPHDGDEDDHTNYDNNGNEDSGVPADSTSLQLTLKDYDSTTVETLVQLTTRNIPITQFFQDAADDDDPNNNHVDQAQLLVDLTRLAHYLQHGALLKELVSTLQACIDTTNCWAIAQLADALDLRTLFEAALRHMIESLSNLEASEECWEALTPELQERCQAIRAAMASSVHNQRSKLYFASLKEYLGKSSVLPPTTVSAFIMHDHSPSLMCVLTCHAAIFAERVHYYQERLAQAKEQQAEHPYPDGPAWKDAQQKIARQEARFLTLHRALTEQKKLFGAGKAQ
jgi:hypothetical protein